MQKQSLSSPPKRYEPPRGAVRLLRHNSWLILVLALFAVPAISVFAPEPDSVIVWAFPLMLMVVSLVYDTIWPLAAVLAGTALSRFLLWRRLVAQGGQNAAQTGLVLHTVFLLALFCWDFS